MAVGMHHFQLVKLLECYPIRSDSIPHFKMPKFKILWTYISFDDRIDRQQEMKLSFINHYVS